MHTTMLLGAAKLLKHYQQDLVGTVKLVFQPDEEDSPEQRQCLRPVFWKIPM